MYCNIMALAFYPIDSVQSMIIIIKKNFSKLTKLHDITILSYGEFDNRCDSLIKFYRRVYYYIGIILAGKHGILFVSTTSFFRVGKYRW